MRLYVCVHRPITRGLHAADDTLAWASACGQASDCMGLYRTGLSVYGLWKVQRLKAKYELLVRGRGLGVYTSY